MLIFKTFKAQIPTSCSERQAHFSFKWGSFSGIRGSALLCGTTFRRSTNQQPKTNKQTTNQRTDPKKSRRQRALGERGAYRVRTLQVQRQIQIHTNTKTISLSIIDALSDGSDAAAKICRVSDMLLFRKLDLESGMVL